MYIKKNISHNILKICFQNYYYNDYYRYILQLKLINEHFLLLNIVLLVQQNINAKPTKVATMIIMIVMMMIFM